jgi:hypothetical protein
MYFEKEICRSKTDDILLVTIKGENSIVLAKAKIQNFGWQDKSIELDFTYTNDEYYLEIEVEIFCALIELLNYELGVKSIKLKKKFNYETLNSFSRLEKNYAYNQSMNIIEI